MKDTFTVKDIMEGTGLTRQRVHSLIKSRKIQATIENRRLILSWQDMLKIADNPTILSFLKATLESEKKSLDEAYQIIKENERNIQLAKAIEYARILVEGEPDFDAVEDRKRWRQWLEAGSFFSDLSTIRNPDEE